MRITMLRHTTMHNSDARTLSQIYTDKKVKTEETFFLVLFGGDRIPISYEKYAKMRWCDIIAALHDSKINLKKYSKIHAVPHYIVSHDNRPNDPSAPLPLLERTYIRVRNDDENELWYGWVDESGSQQLIKLNITPEELKKLDYKIPILSVKRRLLLDEVALIKKLSKNENTTYVHKIEIYPALIADLFYQPELNFSHLPLNPKKIFKEALSQAKLFFLGVNTSNSRIYKFPPEILFRIIKFSIDFPKGAHFRKHMNEFFSMFQRILSKRPESQRIVSADPEALKEVENILLLPPKTVLPNNEHDGSKKDIPSQSTSSTNSSAASSQVPLQPHSTRFSLLSSDFCNVDDEEKNKHEAENKCLVRRK